MAPEARIIKCLLCECGTLETDLEVHIKYNHLIYKEAVLKVLYKLHYPPVNKKIVSDMLDICEDAMNDKNMVKNINMSPFSPSKNKRSLSLDSRRGKGKSPKKRKTEDVFERSKKVKSEVSPIKAKKPIRLKKTIHPRKKLQPNQNMVLEDDTSDNPISSKRKSRNGIDYDDVYTRKENTEKQTSAIQKIRQLQENELQCIMDTGTYVQCCDCHKWRLLKDIEDPSLVPEYWICSMNSQDVTANECGKGEGEDVSSDAELVGVEYGCGSLVWIKFPGFPWWPGMVDYCPELEETFQLDEESDSNEAAKYHVVFFDKPSNVARSWMSKDSVMKLQDPENPPKGPIFKNEAVKKRYTHAKTMAVDAVSLPKIERIEKYSFASLFMGKWGENSDDSEDMDRRTPQIDIDARLIGIADFQQPPAVKKTPEPKKIKRKVKKLKEKRFQCRRSESVVSPEFSAENNFICLKCDSHVKLSRNFVENHLRKHRLSLQEYLDKYDVPENKERLVNVRLWVQNSEYLSRISEVAERRRSRSGSQPKVDSTEDDENNIVKPSEMNSVENILIENPRTEPDEVENEVDQEKKKATDALVDEIPIETKTEPLDSSDMAFYGPGDGHSASEAAEDGAASTSTLAVEPVNNDVKTKVYLKPPMSGQLLIAIAVRNLDPRGGQVGASCSDIVAFLSLHFPYYTDNYEECKDMVRRECGMGLDTDSGKENFQMTAEIAESDRILNYVKNNRDKISRSMLEPEFLNIIIERFVKDDSAVLPSSRKPPPFSHKQLAYIALLKIHKTATLEQIVILLKFIFPSLASSGVMEEFRQEFLESIAKSEDIEAKVDKSINITYCLKEQKRSDILDDLRRSSMENLEAVGAALVNESFFDITLPIFQGDK